MFCKNCGAQIADSTLICPNCGTQTGAPVSPPPAPPPLFCSRCGAQNHPLAASCANCGAPLFSSVRNPGAKSKMAAGLLAFLLGALGVHNFYLGYTGKGVGQLLLSILSFGLLSWVSWIWAVVEGVQIFTGTIATDANGVPLTD